MNISRPSHAHSFSAPRECPVSKSVREKAVDAAFTGQISGLISFVENGGDINCLVKTDLWPDGIYLVEAAVHTGQATSFDWLVRHGAKTDKVKIFGNPLLVAAIERYSVDICRTLLKDNIALENMRDRFGSDLMEVVSFRTHCEPGKEIEKMVKEALKKGRPERDNSRNDTFEVHPSKRQKAPVLLSAFSRSSDRL